MSFTSMGWRASAAPFLASLSLGAFASAGDLKAGQVILTGRTVNQVRVFDRTGALLETIEDHLTPSFFENLHLVGSYFDWSAQRLIVLNNFGDFTEDGQFLRFGRPAPHAESYGPDVFDLSMAFVHTQPARDAAGNLYFYLGGEPSDCCPFTTTIRKLSPTFAPLDSFSVLTDSWNSGPIDVTASGDQLYYYRPQSHEIARYDTVTRTQLAPFVLSGVFDLDLLPPRDGSGLLATTGSQILRLDANGVVVQSYSTPGGLGWACVDVDPNGTSFWAVKTESNSAATLHRFDIASGAVELGPVALGDFFVRDVHVIENMPALVRQRR